MMKRHIVIAGTGRAGTSFLVQYLTACGLDTHLSRHPDQQLNEHANAGLEDVPDGDDDLPYVIKSPWFYEFVNRFLERDDIAIEAVILPMRDIVEAASSRVTLELRARFGQEGIKDEYTLWETWAATPGGIVYSLSPIDQARILAMGFHQVIYALVRKDVPIVFLDFPRLAQDADYLYRQLAPILGQVSRDAAIIAHKSTAKPDLIRLQKEIDEGEAGQVFAPAIHFPDQSILDRAALLRELDNVRAAARQHRDSAAMATERCSAAESALDLHRNVEETLRQQIAALEAELSTARQQAYQLTASLERNQQRLAEVLSAARWRAKYPVRALISALRRVFEGA
jgi:hypothetical protein